MPRDASLRAVGEGGSRVMGVDQCLLRGPVREKG